MKTCKFWGINKEFNMDENPHIVFSVENHGKLYEIHRDLAQDNIEKQMSFFDGENLISIDKIAYFIPNLANLEINTKRNMNALTKVLKKAYSLELRDNIEELENMFTSIMEKIALDFEIEIDYRAEISIDDIFRVSNLQLKDPTGDALSDLIQYMKTIRELNKTDIFIFCSLHQYFDDETIKNIYKECDYLKMMTIDIEGIVTPKCVDGEKTIILDHDFCCLC